MRAHDRETRNRCCSRVRMQRLRARQRQGLKQLRVFLNDDSVETYMRATNPKLANADEATVWRAAEEWVTQKLAEILARGDA